MENRFNPNWGIVAAAGVMAMATFMPIVHIPIVGTVNYVAQGHGDGMIVLGLAAVIAGLGVYQYHRVAALVGLLSLAIMIGTCVRLAQALSDFHDRAMHVPKDNPFGRGIMAVASYSAGLEWGWLPLFGSALAVMILGMLGWQQQMGAQRKQGPAQVEPVLDADKIVARYIKRQKEVRPRSATSAAPQFGRRKRF